MKSVYVATLLSWALSASATSDEGNKACGNKKEWDRCVWDKCIPQHELEKMVPHYVSTFEGITDGGEVAEKIFHPDFQLYSQSLWWVVGRPDIIAEHAEADDFPPIFPDRDTLIADRSAAVPNPGAYQFGPVAYGCNTFSFYWKGDFNVPGGTPRGRGNGIDMVFLDYWTKQIKTAYTEHNTLNQAYNWGAHITWSENPVCCECPTVFDPTCKCPSA